jgi:hypothetical protein
MSKSAATAALGGNGRGNQAHKFPRYYIGIKKFLSSDFFTDFQAFSFILHLRLGIFPLVFYHPLEPVDPCSEDSYEGFLSHFVENVADRVFLSSASQGCHIHWVFP